MKKMYLLLILFLSSNLISQRQFIYWRGEYLYKNHIQSQNVFTRGFTHVVLKEGREIKKFDGFFDLYSFFLKDSLKVIQRVDLGYNRQINDEFSLRSVSPFMNPIEYEIVKQQFVAYLEEHGKAISGIVDDIEEYPFITRKYDVNGSDITNTLYPYNPYEEFEYRIGNKNDIKNALWPSFYNYLDSLGYKNYGYLYRDDIEFTFPEIDISQASVNSEEIFGIENEKFNGMYDVVAQTFKPNKPMLSRIDIKIWRVSNSLENDIFSGDILYYITETKKVYSKLNPKTEIYVPDLARKIGLPQKEKKTIFSEQIVNHSNNKINDNSIIKLYFNPLEIGELDTSKTYAFVLEYKSRSSSGKPNQSYYKLDSSSDNKYHKGKYFRGGKLSWQSMKNETDLWFRTYSPNPPTEKLINIRKLWVDFQSINMQKYINDYVKITQNYNIKNNSNVKVYVYSGYQDKIYYGETCKERYSLDWNKMRTLGIDYAVCGYNESKEVAIKTKNILGDVKLIGSVMYHKGQILESLKKKFQYQIENKEVFDGGVMFFFSGGIQIDPKIVVE